MSEIDDYLADLSPEQRAAFEHIRALVHAEVPDVTEGKSYGMPAFLRRGRAFLGFKAAKGHLSLFPFGTEPVDAVAARLEGFSLSKGTIRFTPENPIPDDVLVDLIHHPR